MRWWLGLDPARTQTRPEEQACLLRWAEGRRIVVEIGVFEGVTTAALRRVLDPEAVLFAVDPFFAGRLGICYGQWIAHGEVARAEGAEVVWLRCRGDEAPARFRALSPGLAELVFVDADHSYEGIRRDFEAWRPLLAPGGIIAFHDSAPVPGMPPYLIENSVRYVSEVVDHDPDLEPVETVASLRIFRNLRTPPDAGRGYRAVSDVRCSDVSSGT